jgi:hypothetical protein
MVPAGRLCMMYISGKLNVDIIGWWRWTQMHTCHVQVIRSRVPCIAGAC